MEWLLQARRIWRVIPASESEDPDPAPGGFVWAPATMGAGGGSMGNSCGKSSTSIGTAVTVDDEVMAV